MLLAKRLTFLLAGVLWEFSTPQYVWANHYPDQVICRSKAGRLSNFCGSIKLNTGRCWQESYGKGSFGALFRDSNGDWIMGFFGKLTCESSLEAEPWGIYRGLTIMLEKSLMNVTIKSDALLAVNLITEGNPGNHAQSVIINEAHGLLTRMGMTLTHIYRNVNQCADHLAHLGAEQNDNLVLVVDIPFSFMEFIIRDSLNLRQFID